MLLVQIYQAKPDFPHLKCRVVFGERHFAEIFAMSVSLWQTERDGRNTKRKGAGRGIVAGRGTGRGIVLVCEDRRVEDSSCVLGGCAGSCGRVRWR